MTMNLRWRAAAALTLTAAAVAVAGCGGGGSDSAASDPYGGAVKAQAPAKTSGTASVSLAKTDLGSILTDGQGRTLYLFEADKGAKSACDGACASLWPPLTTGAKPKAGSGISAAKLGTTKRGDGSAEVTYNGHPLYTYAGDTSPGQTTGQGIDSFGAEWYVLSAAGTQIGD
jgi:predicted lipoprotein with Yx(FWY)xxD motif